MGEVQSCFARCAENSKGGKGQASSMKRPRGSIYTREEREALNCQSLKRA